MTTYPFREEIDMTPRIVATLAAAGLLAAPVAGPVRAAPPPAVQAEFSKQIEIRTAELPSPEAIQAVLAALEGSPAERKQPFQVRFRASAEPEKGSVVRIDVSGETIATEAIPGAVRAASPEFSAAEVSVRVVQASVDGEVAGLVGPRALRERLTPEQIDAEVRSRLAAQGVQGDVKVDVKTSEADGKVRHEVKVIVEKKEEAGAR